MSLKGNQTQGDFSATGTIDFGSEFVDGGSLDALNRVGGHVQTS